MAFYYQLMLLHGVLVQDARTLLVEEEEDKLLTEYKAQVLEAFTRAKRHFEQTNKEFTEANKKDLERSISM
eukprot:6060588-Pyramimonas_sp.AAC.2